MPTYYIHDVPSASQFKLAGALEGEDVAQFARCCRKACSATAGGAFVVDVSELIPLDEAGRELLHQLPVFHCHVIDGEIPLRHHFFEVSEAKSKAEIPANTQKDDLRFKMSGFEQCWPALEHEHASVSDRAAEVGNTSLCLTQIHA
jgi:hypothetical protein